MAAVHNHFNYTPLHRTGLDFIVTSRPITCNTLLEQVFFFLFLITTLKVTRFPIQFAVKFCLKKAVDGDFICFFECIGETTF